MSVLDRIYSNHPGLDTRYRDIFNKAPGIEHHIEQLELCDRNGNLTLAIWLCNTPYTNETVVPYILNEFSDIISVEQLRTLTTRMQEEVGSNLVIVNPDKHKGILRYYYRTQRTGDKVNDLRGEDIAPDGSIIKTKVYIGDAITGDIYTEHLHANGTTKKTYASFKSYSIKHPGCLHIISRDDGQTYYLYNKESYKQWNYQN